MTPEPTPELLLRLTRPGPRYTSYPTVPLWSRDFPVEAFVEGLQGLRAPSSVYVHVPFCKEQCTFCGCNMVVSGRRDSGTRYLDELERQVEALPLAQESVEVVRIHLGGGTPTWLEPQDLERLYAIVRRRFKPIEGAELSVEADPEVTTDEQVDTLAALGVTRLSMGVQSFDPVVLAAVNRPQEHTRVHAIMERCRSLGMGSLNLDLMTGLPHQTLERFEDTLAKTLEMRPDRLAIFGYAHVPWLKAHQKKLDAAALPGPVERVELFLMAHRVLLEQGYQAIGMDHFALPDDELAVAQRAGALHRNFMGYTTRPDVELVGLGMSAISELRDVYVQLEPKLSRWWKADGRMAIERGCVLTAEDRLRREVINRLMCNGVLPFAAVEQSHGIEFARHFAGELNDLSELEGQGLVERHSDRLQLSPLGKLLVRNVAMVFDPSLKQKSATPRFSQTV